MHVVYHSLGEQEHIYVTKLLKIRSTTCIALSFVNTLPNLTSLFRHDVKTLLNSGAWIDSGKSFQIHLSVNLEADVFENGYVAKYMDDLGAVLCNAEMWSQLDVSVSLQSLQDEVDHTSRSQRLRFDVTPAHEFSLTKSQCGAPLTRNHLKPPIGIPCMNLDFIDLRLNLSRCPSIQPKSAKRKRNEHSEGSREYEEDLPRELMNGFSTRIPVDSDEGIARSVRGLDDSSPIESPKRIGSPSINKRNMEPNDVCPRPTATPRSVGISSSNTASKRPSSPTHKLNLADLVKLVDFSLRGIICSPKTPMSLGVLLSSVTEHPRLEHLSPALFSPGYSEAVVQRTPFISNIASTLSDLSRRVISPTLRRKLRWLREDANETEAPRESRQIQYSFYGCAEASIWAMLRYQSYDAAACTKLKSLNPSRKGPDDDRFVGHMLDDISQGVYDEPGHISEEAEALLDFAAEQIFEIDSKKEVTDHASAAALPDIIEDDSLPADDYDPNFDTEEDLFWEELEADNDRFSPLASPSESFPGTDDISLGTETQCQLTHHIPLAAVDDGSIDGDLLDVTFAPSLPDTFISLEQKFPYREGLNIERRSEEQDSLLTWEDFKHYQTPETTIETTHELAPDENTVDDTKIVPYPAMSNGNDRALRIYLPEESDDLLDC